MEIWPDVVIWGFFLTPLVWPFVVIIQSRSWAKARKAWALGTKICMYIRGAKSQTYISPWSSGQCFTAFHYGSALHVRFLSLLFFSFFF